MDRIIVNTAYGENDCAELRQLIFERTKSPSIQTAGIDRMEFNHSLYCIGKGLGLDNILLSNVKVTFPEGDKTYRQYDFPLAVGLFALANNIQPREDILYVGEIGENGKPTLSTFSLLFAELAKKKKFQAIVLSSIGACQAVDLEGITVFSVRSISQIFDIARGNPALQCVQKLRKPKDRIIRGRNFKALTTVTNRNLLKVLEAVIVGGYNLLIISKDRELTDLALCWLDFIRQSLPLTKSDRENISRNYSSCKNTTFTGYALCPPVYYMFAKDAPSFFFSRNESPSAFRLAHKGFLVLRDLDTLPDVKDDDGKCEKRLYSACKFKKEPKLLSEELNPEGYYQTDFRFIATISGDENDVKQLSSQRASLFGLFDLAIYLNSIDDVIDGNVEFEPEPLIIKRIKAACKRQKERLADTDSSKKSTQINSKEESEKSRIKLLRISRTFADLDDAEDIENPHLEAAKKYII